MRANVEVLFFGDGGESLGTTSFPVAVAEFDLEGFVEDFGKWLGEYLVSAATDDYEILLAGIASDLSSLGGNVKDSKNGTFTVGQGGRFDAGKPPASYAVILFHAWTGDDIKPSFGKIVPLDGRIVDWGELRYTQGDFQYYYRFGVPFSLVQAGKYAFAFGTGDSGPVQDAAIGYAVGMGITRGLRGLGIQEKYAALGSGQGFLGSPQTDQLTTPDGIGRYRHFANGSIYWCPGRGAFEVHGAIRDKWSSLGWEQSTLGYPITDESGTPDGVGRYNHFQWGSIYWHPDLGAWEIHGSIREKWASLGWEQSYLGYPTSDQTQDADKSWFNTFQGGIIRWTDRGGAVDSAAERTATGV
jgi:hypothetical protein